MWITLTDLCGQPVALNTRHIVAVQPHGERTMITHVGGQTLVADNAAAIIDALGLHASKSREDRPRPGIVLHS